MLSDPKPKTMQMILEKPGTLPVKVLRKQSESHEVLVGAFMVKVMEEATKQFPNKFDSDNLSDCAYMLMNEYPDWKPEEIIPMLRNGIAGKYGKIYHAISTAAILEWAACYEGERQAWHERKDMQRMGNNSKDAIISVDPKIIEETRRLADKFIGKSDKPMHVYSTDKPEDKVQVFIRDFDKLAKDQRDKDKPFKPVTFVRYNEQMLDLDGYLIERMEELQPGFKALKKAAAKQKQPTTK